MDKKNCVILGRFPLNFSIDVNFNDHIYQAVHNNCEIIDDRNDNWSHAACFSRRSTILEAYN